MDRKNDGGSGRARNSSIGGANGKRSYEAATPMSPKLRKKRSISALSATTPSLSRFNAQPGADSNAGSGQIERGGVGLREGTKARKGSIRDAVKRIFGRRSRDIGSTVPRTSPPPRHTYHHSDSTILAPQPEVPEPFPRDEEFAQPSLPESYNLPSTQQFSRVGSPSFALFPKSAQLQPLDLGNPFQRKELTRRKTLPSVVLSEREAAAVATVAAALGTPHAQTTSDSESPTRKTRLAGKSSRHAKRLSRSTDDLRSAISGELTLQRKRSEEIRYWRESFQPDMMSMPVSARPAGDEVTENQENTTPVARSDPFEMAAVSRPVSRPGTMASSPPYHHQRGHSQSETGMQSPSGIGTEMSKELEDRVAKLEAGLQNFQHSLQRLTADRNRRTVVMGGVTARQSTSDMRTPSMLADTLSDPLEPSSYRYEYRHAMRPATSPQPPRSQTPEHQDPFAHEIPRTPVSPASIRPAERIPQRGRERSVTAQPPPPMPSPPLPSPPPRSAAIPAAGSKDERSQQQQQQQQPYTFQSLYQMLADERSARRKLERKLRNLQSEISDLTTQVASASNLQSQRSSYIPRDSMAGSSRLAEILRETESSPPGTSAAENQRGSTLFAAPVAISRFSNSESEAGATEYEDAMSYEAYETPAEDAGRFTFGGRHQEQRGERMERMF